MYKHLADRGMAGKIIAPIVNSLSSVVYIHAPHVTQFSVMITIFPLLRIVNLLFHFLQCRLVYEFIIEISKNMF